MRLRSWTLATVPALCAVILSVPLLAQEACDDPRRIFGGEDTEITVHPWQVALDIDGELCGGAIVAPQWVLTAAHCFDSDDARKVRVKAGATEYKKGGEWKPVERIVRRQFDPKTKENDVALVKAKTALAGLPINRSSPELKLAHCQLLEVTGWGRTNKGPRSAKLQKATIPYVDTAICNEQRSYRGRVSSNMICAGFRGIDACAGDSGGPLVLRKAESEGGDVLVGIVSWGEGCGKDFKFGVYTRVAVHRDWIDKVIASDGK